MNARDRQVQQIQDLSAEWFIAMLHSPEGQQARRWLLEECDYNLSSLKDFQLGYAPKRWNSLFEHFTKSWGLPVDLLQTAGLVVPCSGGNGFYDRFRDQVMVPVRDRQGHVVGFHHFQEH